jgi:hypothetical protein
LVVVGGGFLWLVVGFFCWWWLVVVFFINGGFGAKSRQTHPHTNAAWLRSFAKPIVGKLKEKIIKFRTDKGKTVSSTSRVSHMLSVSDHRS